MNLDRPGSAVSINRDYLTASKSIEPTGVRKVPYEKTKVSRSLYVISSTKVWRKKIRPIEEKKNKPHDFRTSLATVERRYICDWCDQRRLDNPLHFF